MSLNESPSEKEGKSLALSVLALVASLNESPSEKEGKFSRQQRRARTAGPSMKVPPKRKGNGKHWALCCI